MFHRNLVILCMAWLGAAPNAALAQTWTIQNVDVGNQSGTSTSIGLTAGYPVISYFAAPRNLRYASLDPQTKAWKLADVDQGGEYSSLDVDAAGIVHVSYVDENTRQVRYYRNNQGLASIQIIDSETGSGGFASFNSLRVDGNGVPRVSYYYARSPDGSTNLDHVKYAQLVGSTWSRTDADPASGRGRYNSLALDVFGSPQIAYYDGTARRLRIARRNPLGVWSSQIVDSTASDPGRFNSIAVDLTNGLARISYIAATTQKVRYAAYNGTTWSIEDVDGVGLVGSNDATSLRLDSSGNPHISYYNAAAGALMYASKTGASWVVDTVDTQGDVGGYSSLVLDDQDRPIISYYDATNQALKIAYGNYADTDSDGIPDTFDPFPNNPDANSNGIQDGLEGGVLQGVRGTRLPDEPIFGCGSIGPFPGGGSGGPPPIDLLFMLAPAAYLVRRRFLLVRSRHTELG
jgi:hypothetical protein